MQREERERHTDGVGAHPLAELLACPAAVGNLLNAAAECIQVEAGEIIFRQSTPCRGLYVVVSGQFIRKAERLSTRVTLGMARAGDLVEMAAALGDGNHTYTLSAQIAGAVMLLPIDALQRAFEAYPLLRMKLLEELAREVSRAYGTCCVTRTAVTRRRAILPATG